MKKITYFFLFFSILKTNCLQINLAHEKIVANKFRDLVDGVKNPYESTSYNVVTPKNPFIINLEGYFTITAVHLFQGFYKAGKNPGKIIVFLKIENYTNVECGNFHSKKFVIEKFVVLCRFRFNANEVSIKVSNDEIRLSEVEIYGEMRKKNTQLFFGHGCFKNIIMLNNISFVSVERCINHCRSKNFKFTALNKIICSCLDSPLDLTSTDFSSCSEPCPSSSYFCGSSNSFRVLEEKNLCFEPELNVCNVQVSDCKYSEGRIQCFCRGTFIKIPPYASNFACEGENTKISKEIVNFEKEIIRNYGPEFPPWVIFSIKAIKEIKFSFVPNCLLDSCNLQLKVKSLTLCPSSFNMVKKEEILKEREVFNITFTNNSTTSKLDCEFKFTAENLEGSKGEKAELTIYTLNTSYSKNVNQDYANSIVLYIGFGSFFVILCLFGIVYSVKDLEPTQAEETR